jgi:hypothetical protein
VALACVLLLLLPQFCVAVLLLLQFCCSRFTGAVLLLQSAVSFYSGVELQTEALRERCVNQAWIKQLCVCCLAAKESLGCPEFSCVGVFNQSMVMLPAVT